MKRTQTDARPVPGARLGRNHDHGAIAAGGNLVRVEVARKRAPAAGPSQSRPVSPLSSASRWQSVEESWRREMRRLQEAEQADIA
jgi:hypothetical protein